MLLGNVEIRHLSFPDEEVVGGEGPDCPPLLHQTWQWVSHQPPGGWGGDLGNGAGLSQEVTLPSMFRDSSFATMALECVHLCSISEKEGESVLDNGLMRLELNIIIVFVCLWGASMCVCTAVHMLVEARRSTLGIISHVPSYFACLSQSLSLNL